MRYTARFVFWHYDEWDTTLANIYDVRVEAAYPYEAVEVAKKIVAQETRVYSSPGYTDFIDVVGEGGEFPQRTFCSNGETYFTIDLAGKCRMG